MAVSQKYTHQSTQRQSTNKKNPYSTTTNNTVLNKHNHKPKK